MYTAGTCVAGLRTFYPGSRLVFSLFLGDSIPLGGTLTISTCGSTRNNTVLYVGTGCPTWSLSFGCLAGNDNAVPACGANPLAASVALTVTQSTYFVQVGGVNGGDIVSGLRWHYDMASKSPAATPSRTRTGTASHSRSATRSRSGSLTRKRK